MKKILAILSLIGTYYLGYSQDVKVNINNQEAKTSVECPYRINGICITEDIGGVDVSFCQGNGMVLKNFNNFPVTVVWEIQYNSNSRYDGAQKSGNIVIDAKESKSIYVPYTCSNWEVKGVIVRKLDRKSVV